MPCIRLSNSQRTSLGQKTWLCLNYQAKGLLREFILLIDLPSSCCNSSVCQNKWHVVGKWFSSHVLGIPFIIGFYYMTYLHYGHHGTSPGSQLCYCCCAALCCTFSLFPVIERGWGVDQIDFMSRASSVSSGTPWGLGFSWPPGRWHPMPPSPVVACLSVLR